MKTTKWILVLFFFSMFLFAGCKKATYLKAKDENVSISKEGGSDTIILQYDGGKCRIVTQPEWVELNLNDSILTIQTDQNKASSARSGNIIVENGDLKLSIPVKQLSSATYLTFSEKNVTIPKDGSRVELEVETDGSKVTLEGVETVTAEYKNGKVIFSGQGNNGKERRTNAYLVADSIKRPITIIEKGEYCFVCNGTGRVKCTRCGGTGETVFPWGPCYICHSSGKVKCKSCKGTGK